MHHNFRKSFMIIAIVICCYTAVAQQRVCDQEVVCISPADTVINGNALPLRFEMVNHGPDVKFANDTTLYMLYRIEENNEQRIVYQGMISGRGNDTIGIGGSSRYVDNYTIRFSYPDRTDTFTIDFCVLIASSGIFSNGDTFHLSYTDPNSDNNTCCRQVTIIPKESTFISNTHSVNDELQIYPNPAKNILYLQVTDKDAIGDLVVIIRDITGKELLQRRYNSREVTDGNLTVNVDQLPSGIYSISLQTAKNTFSKKISINR